ncbi:MAG: hypothetical protein NTW50_00320 [Candidatus Berkelbacteria bacterium]|nr:hypothetical protein [Candidatus Berkelbacteria bacterium]
MTSKIQLPKIKFPKVKIDFSKFKLSKVKTVCSSCNWEMILSILAYLPVLFLIPLIFKMFKNDFVWYHVRQGIVLSGVWIIFIFSFYLPLLPWLVGLYLVFCLVVGIVNVSTGKSRPLPLLGFLAV